MVLVSEKHEAPPDVWQKMSRDQQQDHIDSIEGDVRTAVEECVKMIASDDRPHVFAKVEQVVFKGGVEAKQKIEHSMDEHGAPSGAHELTDHTDRLVIVILPSVEDYTDNMGKPQASDDLPDLLEIESDELYDDAVRLVEMMERLGVISEADDKSQRTVLG